MEKLRIWSDFVISVDAIYKQYVPLFIELLDLQLYHNPFKTYCMNERISSFIDKMVKYMLVLPNFKETVETLPLRSLPLHAFPFWRCSATLVDAAAAYRTEYVKKITLSGLDLETKANLMVFAESLNGDLPINLIAKGPDSLIPYEKYQVIGMFLTLQTFDLTNPGPLWNMDPCKRKPKGDISEMARDSKIKNTMFDISTSEKCPGSGVFSRMTFGGREEMLHYKHLGPCLMSLFGVGTPNLYGDKCGRSNWKPGFKPTEQLICFRYDMTRNNWFQYHASIKRDWEAMPSVEEEISDFRRSFYSSELLCKIRELEFVTGERGCGTRGGRISSIMKAIEILSSRTTICIWALDE